MTSREKAELLVDGWTGGRAKNAQGYKKERVEKLIEYISEEVSNRDAQPTNLKSVSNDKYSETYELMTEEAFMKGLKVKAYEILSGTGLMGCL